MLFKTHNPTLQFPMEIGLSFIFPTGKKQIVIKNIITTQKEKHLNFKWKKRSKRENILEKSK